MAMRNIERFCDLFRKLLEEKPVMSRVIDAGSSIMAELISEREWFGDILQKVLFDPTFNENQKIGIWPNEITLYRSPDRSFQILCYIWESYVKDAVHDHGSWGIIGSFVQPFRERKYKRLDDGKTEGYAVLEEVSSAIIEPGRVTHVLPLNKGIHSMENVSSDIAITINVYGRNIRKGYIQFYNPEKNSVARVYPPKSLREKLAIRAAAALRGPWSEEILKSVLVSNLPDHIKKEGEISLKKLKSFS
ncbi:MAG TPA: cysteine dioxygenase family protein [Syntrophales bacterium]|nr:cysteine dioxygenase family protein [Syntrophales bacterium]